MEDYRKIYGDEFVEKLAALCHEQWSGWMEYLFSKCQRLSSTANFQTGESADIIPSWAVRRWQRQLATPYIDLTEEEKESDRKEADKFMELIYLNEGKLALSRVEHLILKNGS